MNAERLLGSLIWGGLRSGMRRPGRGMLGLGLLGLAIAAYEHFSQQGGVGGGGRPLPPPGPLPPRGAGPSGVPGTGSTPGRAVPPPPPGSPEASPAPPRPVAPVREASSGGDTEAVLLIRAMIAAAYADGHLDEEERERIQSRLDGAGMDAEERAFMEREMAKPVSTAELVAGATTPELAEQVYAASLLAIEVDTAEERGYLAGLARLLGIDDEAVRRLHLLAGAPRP